MADEKKKIIEDVTTAAEFRKNPAAVIERAFTHGSVIIIGPGPDDRVRFVTQQHDVDVE